MKIFLRLKHWHLFVLMLGPAIMLDIFLFGSFVLPLDRSYIGILFPWVMIFSFSIFFGWLYAMGTKLHNQLPGNVYMNRVLFVILWLVAFIIILLTCVLIFTSINRALADEEPRGLSISFGWVFLLYLIFMSSIFYCFYFIAKTLKAVELQSPVSVGDYLGEFFLLWFYIIGVWIIQPRVNKLFRKKEHASPYF